MKSMFIIAALIAVAVATPVTPGATGPAAIQEPIPIAVQPAPIETEIPAVGGAAPVDYIPISVGPGHVQEIPIPIGGPSPIDDSLLVPVATGPASIEGFEDISDNVINIPSSNGSPFIQIIVKISNPTVEIAQPIAPAVVPELIPGGVNFVESPEVIIEPVEIGSPVIPVPVPESIPVAIAPELLN